MELLHYIDIGNVVDSNKTHVILSVPLLDRQNASYLGKKEDDYDAEGAMVFIVATVSIYSLGIVAFIAGHLFDKSKRLANDLKTSEYISTFNSAHLEQLSKMYMLRFMQRKLLAQYNMLDDKSGRNIHVRRSNVASYRNECRPGGSMDNIPRIFQDAALRRSTYLLDTISSVNRSSISSEAISLTNVSDDISMDSNGVEPVSGSSSMQNVDQIFVDDVSYADVNDDANEFKIAQCNQKREFDDEIRIILEDSKDDLK